MEMVVRHNGDGGANGLLLIRQNLTIEDNGATIAPSECEGSRTSAS
jgi:hypothetical protein